MSSSQYVGLGLIVLLACAGGHWVLWNRTAGPALSSADTAVRVAALKRWLKAIVVVEILGLAAAAGWLLALRSSSSGLAWIAPPLGLVAGNAFPLQLAVLGITRSAKAPR